MLAGRFLATTWPGAWLAGSGLSLLTILAYLGGAWEPVWLIAAVLGGAAGGLAGHLTRTRSWAWLAVTALAAARLVQYGPGVWDSMIGAVHGSLLVALGLAAVLPPVLKASAGR